MMFCAYIPYISETSHKVKRPEPIHEEQYFETDTELLKDFSCPKCKENKLFRGLVYIGCNACLTYFSEKEIIEGNI
jgi:hypothetical protein